MTSRASYLGEPERLGRLVDFEALTGLPDRAHLVDLLRAAVAQAHREEHLVALVVIDLNTSTEMRAALGLEGGKRLTLMVANHLRRFARKSDTLAYIGSDLFAIVMPQVHDLPQILGLTTRLIGLFDGSWELAGQSLHLVPGVGIAFVPENGTEPAELVAQAVTAASYAAREGDRHPRLADRHGHAAAVASLALEADLRGALEQGELCLHYQPQVSAATGCVCGFEALIRWQHPEHGMIMPDEFIPLAEATHLILPIGAWVIDEACAQLARWRDAGHRGVRVAVNLAARQLVPEILLVQVREALEKHGLEPCQLEVEITESSAIFDATATGRVIEALKNLGVRVTLDDYGTGYSSTLLLAQYPFDTLKIDRSFVARILAGPRERALTAGIIRLAHDVNMSVVAEGVETREQLALMRDLGADEVQGFFFSRPLSVTGCEPFLVGRCNVEDGRLAFAAAQRDRSTVRGGLAMSPRNVKLVRAAQPTVEGAGVHLRRAFGAGPDTELFDPFLMMDDFRGDHPSQYSAGFPWHPHRGIETITYMIEGTCDHGDSMGNEGTIGTGDVQWMTAGSGIIHQEMPRGDEHGRMGGFQVWANLPAAQKMRDPRYEGIESAQIPEVDDAGARIRVIAGRVGGVSGPVTDITVEPEYLDVTLAPDAAWTHAVASGHNVFAYLFEGECRFEEAGESVAAGSGRIVLFDEGEAVAVSAGGQGGRFLLLSGKPLHEPVAWRGPIVMNTREELEVASRELSTGTFVKHAAAGR